MPRLAILVGFALLTLAGTAEAKVLRMGEACRPAVAKPEMYASCRIVVTARGETCRCVVLSRAISGAQARGALQPAVWGNNGPTSGGEGSHGTASTEAVAADSGADRSVSAPAAAGVRETDGPRHSDPIPGPAT